MGLRAPDYWQRRQGLALLLYPLSLLFAGLVWLRRLCFRSGLKHSKAAAVPVIVVGNLTVGGAGKTPLVIALVKRLQQIGWQPAVVSRGYGGSATVPTLVDKTADHNVVGDEALMLARCTGVPVAVSPRRIAAAELLTSTYDCDVIVSDDGMQHYELERQVEICVVDSITGLGNGWCLPAGPLREPPSRLREVDLIVLGGKTEGGNGKSQLITKLFDSGLAETIQKPKILAYTIQVESVVNLQNMAVCKSLADFSDNPVHAVAAIGRPDKFFTQLRAAGLNIIEHPFADHHVFRPSDLDFDDDLHVLMTAKDGVKCETWAQHNFWVVSVVAKLDDGIVDAVLDRLPRRA